MSLESLLDFDQPFNVDLFEQTVIAFMEGGNIAVQPFLVTFQDHPLAWTRVDSILEQSKSQTTKLVALNILENTVKFKWNALPSGQKEGIKTYIVNKIIALSSDSNSLKNYATLLTKLNMVLVQIVKQEWPHNWPNFVPELVAASKTSQSLCANNMQILKLLSEEIFDYSGGQMTSVKMKEMKKNLNHQFTYIYQLCDYVFEHSNDPVLLLSTLQTLLRFLQWIPIGYIFETKLIETLVLKFFPVALFQNDTLQSLGEIAALPLKDPEEAKYQQKMVQMFIAIISQVAKLITPETDVAKVYESGNDSAQTFIRHLTLFLTTYLKNHQQLLENGDDTTRQAVLASIAILLRISKIDDPVIFKICLEYWSHFVTDLYNSQRMISTRAPMNAWGAMGGGLTINSGGIFHGMQMSPRLHLYAPSLAQLRHVMIAKMAKPEEVLIVEDENGQIIREPLKDTDAVTLYKSMREVLIYLTHLDPNDTQETMLHKLAKQVDSTDYSWNALNTLCWAIGSISGALFEQQEKTFLVKVIKDLLGLCEQKRGKDHKAVIASNIMYVVGQYPRFLKQHWKFLKTVVNKLFEFMHETHPGVQDMSVDTFLTICRRCKKKFVTVQLQETRPFIEEIIENLPQTISKLEPSQIHTFYEAVGEIIAAVPMPAERQRLLFALMELPNQSWAALIVQANNTPDILLDPKTVKQIVFVLKTNTFVASSLRSPFIVQLAKIYVEMLQLYKVYSNYVSMKIASEGVGATQTAIIRSMRAVKKEILNLLRTFVTNASDSDKEAILKNFLPELIAPVLDDYRTNVPMARDSEVLSLFAEFTNKLGASISPYILRIFDSVFSCTLEMITKNFEDFPDVRLNFFRLIESINRYAFASILTFTAPQFQLVMDSIVWGIKHLDKNIADTGLQILFDLINNIATSEFSNDFFKTFYISMLQDILGVLTDTFHKPGFRLHSAILAKLFGLVETNAITAPLWTNPMFNPTGASFANNGLFVRTVVASLVGKAFPNLTSHQIEQFVMGLFHYHAMLTEFKNHLRDFLVQIKDYNKDENVQDLYLEENQRRQEEEKVKIGAVPGLNYETRGQQQVDGGMQDESSSSSAVAIDI